jgi:hypothetical protein
LLLIYSRKKKQPRKWNAEKREKRLLGHPTDTMWRNPKKDGFNKQK